jgi:hypothetical protein
MRRNSEDVSYEPSQQRAGETSDKTAAPQRKRRHPASFGKDRYGNFLDGRRRKKGLHTAQWRRQSPQNAALVIAARLLAGCNQAEACRVAGYAHATAHHGAWHIVRRPIVRDALITVARQRCQDDAALQPVIAAADTLDTPDLVDALIAKLAEIDQSRIDAMYAPVAASASPITKERSGLPADTASVNAWPYPWPPEHDSTAHASGAAQVQDNAVAQSAPQPALTDEEREAEATRQELAKREADIQAYVAEQMRKLDEARLRRPYHPGAR